MLLKTTYSNGRVTMARPGIRPIGVCLCPWVRSRTHRPQIFFHGLTPCVYAGGTTHRFFGDLSHPDLPCTTILSQRGTRQGCPLWAQLFALGLHPLLRSVARLVGQNKSQSVLSYSDDLHLWWALPLL